MDEQYVIRDTTNGTEWETRRPGLANAKREALYFAFYKRCETEVVDTDGRSVLRITPDLDDGDGVLRP